MQPRKAGAPHKGWKAAAAKAQASSDEAIEAGAQALLNQTRQDNGLPLIDWKKVPRGDKPVWRKRAKAVLEAAAATL